MDLIFGEGILWGRGRALRIAVALIDGQECPSYFRSFGCDT